MGFADYIREYELQRGEGVLLRTVNDVYKVLAHTVPDKIKNDELREFEIELALVLRSVDSSLLDEWDRLRTDFTALGGSAALAGASDVASGRDAGQGSPSAGDLDAQSATLEGQRSQFRRRWRTESFRLLRALGSGDAEESENIAREWAGLGVREFSFSFELESVQVSDAERASASEWTAAKFESVLRLLKTGGFKGIRTDLKAKNAALTRFSFLEGLHGELEQTVLDLESDTTAFLRIVF